MFNTAKVDYLLCGSLEDEEKAKTQKKKLRKWFIDNVWRGAGREGGGMCRRGVSCVSGCHNVSVTRGQGCLYL